jgi:hypothetical protein
MVNPPGKKVPCEIYLPFILFSHTLVARLQTFEDDLRVMVYEMREHDVWRVYAPARMDSARTVPPDSISAVFRQAVVEINPPSILHRESEYWDGNENGKFDRFVGHAPFGRDEDLDLLDEFAVYLDFVDEDGPGGCVQTGRLATLYFDAPLVNHHRVTSVAPPDTQGRITRLNLSIVYPLQFQADTPLVTVGDFLSPSSNHISAIVVESSEYDKYIEVRDVNDPGKGLQDGDWAEAAFLTVYYTTTDVQGETRYDCSCMASDVEHTTTTHELLHMESVGPLEHPCREVNQDNIMWPFAGDRTGVKLRCRGIQVGPVGACIERQEQWSVLQGGL